MTIARAVASFVAMQGRTNSEAVIRFFPHIQRSTMLKAIQKAALLGLIQMESPQVLRAPKRKTTTRIRAGKETA